MTDRSRDACHESSPSVANLSAFGATTTHPGYAVGLLDPATPGGDPAGAGGGAREVSGPDLKNVCSLRRSWVQAPRTS